MLHSYLHVSRLNFNIVLWATSINYCHILLSFRLLSLCFNRHEVKI